MTQLSINLPDEFMAKVGSEDAARNLMLGSAVAELLRRGLVDQATAEAWLGESLLDWMRLADAGGSFEFWHDPEEDVYTLNDGEPI